MKIKLSLFLLIFTLSNAIAFSEEINPCAKKFITAGWIPYWQKFQGCETVKSKLNFFNELSPFAFEVKSDGSLINTLKINESPWTDLLPKAGDSKILILPTILWTDSKTIHTILNSAAARKRHIRDIIHLIETKNFDGIDIDYEGKDASDKDIFSVFITELSCALKAKGYYLSCTVEAKTADDPPNGWQQTRAMAWANDFSILNKYCDEIRIMAYDQPFQTKGAKEWQDDSEYPYAANADILWVEKVIKYALQKIAPEKIVLGIPTYGWEFTIKGTSKNWSYKRFKSTTYPQAVELAKSYSMIPKRDHSGELSFIYQKETENYLDYFPDGESIRQKIQLAKKYRLGGIVFFKLDGLEDKKMWESLKEELGAGQEKFLIGTDHAEKIGTPQNPIIDSDMTLQEALRKECPPEFKEKQRLVDVTYYSFDGKIHKGQLVIDERLVKDIRKVFQVALKHKFPITSVIPISHDRFFKNGRWNEDDLSMAANNTSAFNYRVITGGKSLSKHAYGFAIDINPLQNPYIKKGVVLPPGAVYDTEKPGTLTHNSPVVKTFLRLGWTWGGDWKSLKDYQHFEKVPGN